MSKVHVCDICGRQMTMPDIDGKFRTYKTGYFGVYTEKIELCTRCVDTLRNISRNLAEEFKRG